MFQNQRSATHGQSALSSLSLIYTMAVRGARVSNRSPIIAIFLNMMRVIILMLVFRFFMSLMGRGPAAGIGDPTLFLMSGIMLFVTHNAAVSAVMNADNSNSAIMQHAQMNILIAICATSLSLLYVNVLTSSIILFLYHALFNPVTIDDPVGAFGMFLLAWSSGIAVGMMFKAAAPWIPMIVGLASTFYRRANMITSGKMFLASTIPAHLWPVFAWNPLFHSIDQGRGFIFINYNAAKTSIAYPLQLSLALIAIGLIGQFYSRKFVSASWGKAR